MAGLLGLGVIVSVLDGDILRQLTAEFQRIGELLRGYPATHTVLIFPRDPVELLVSKVNPGEPRYQVLSDAFAFAVHE